jgi:hypothetical protein
MGCGSSFDSVFWRLCPWRQHCIGAGSTNIRIISIFRYMCWWTLILLAEEWISVYSYNKKIHRLVLMSGSVHMFGVWCLLFLPHKHIGSLLKCLSIVQFNVSKSPELRSVILTGGGCIKKDQSLATTFLSSGRSVHEHRGTHREYENTIV